MKVAIKRSLAEVSSLLEFVGNAYGLRFVGGHLLHSRENDVYRLTTDARSYVLKIYPVGSMAEEKLEFIYSHVLIAYNENYIIRTKSDELKISIRYPEGDRVAVIYTYLKNIGGNENFFDFRAFGEEVARFHDIKPKVFTHEELPYTKFENFIVDACLNNYSKHKLLEALTFIEKFPKDKLENLDVGLCHGDCHIDNAVSTKDGMHLIDFDFMRVDYLASDLISIVWANHYGMGVNNDNLEKFISGYSDKKPVQRMDIDTFMYFMVKKEITYLISYLQRQGIIGEMFVNDQLIINRLMRMNKVSDMPEANRSLKLIISHA